MTVRYLLDTNIVGHIIKGREPALLQQLASVAIGDIAISCITLAEMEYGWHRNGRSARLQRCIQEFLLRAEVLPWDETAAKCYGGLRASWESQGISLSDLDMMIAAHAVATGATLVSRDQAFGHVPDQLSLAVW